MKASDGLTGLRLNSHSFRRQSRACDDSCSSGHSALLRIKHFGAVFRLLIGSCLDSTITVFGGRAELVMIAAQVATLLLC
jgi:hypothetical protein